MSLFREPEVRELLVRREGQFIERKSLWDRSFGSPRLVRRRQVRDWIAEYVAAFANADGGTIILGAEDDGTPTGHKYPEEAIDEFLAVPLRRLRPPVKVPYQRIRINGQELILLAVPMTLEAIMVEGNGFPYRIND